jgi:hypothetical protein
MFFTCFNTSVAFITIYRFLKFILHFYPVRDTPLILELLPPFNAPMPCA